ncbi:unnamed protein product, partial [Brassica napus]
QVADDVKNSRALDGCICEESTELIRTERERGEAKSYTDHTVKHSFHRHLLSFLTDDDAITNLLPSFRLYSRLTILQGGSNCQFGSFMRESGDSYGKAELISLEELKDESKGLIHVDTVKWLTNL